METESTSAILMLLQSVISTPLFAIANLLLTIVAIFLAVFFYRKTRKRKRAFYASKSVKVFRNIGKSLSALSVTCGGNAVSSLTVTKLIFWNAGNETIYHTDIAEADPIEIKTVRDAKILEAVLEKSDNPANQVCVSQPSETMGHRIGFDFLDPREGAVLTIAHTGTSGTDLYLSGTIKGGKNIKKRNAPAIKDVPGAGVVLGTLLTFIGLFILQPFSQHLDKLEKMATLVLYIFITILFLVALGRWYQKRKAPSVKTYEEDITV